jgi:SH3 domain-containing protein
MILNLSTPQRRCVAIRLWISSSSHLHPVLLGHTPHRLLSLSISVKHPTIFGTLLQRTYAAGQALTFEPSFRMFVPCEEGTIRGTPRCPPIEPPRLTIAVYKTRQHRHSTLRMLSRLAMRALVLAVFVGGAIWVSKQFFAAQPASQTRVDDNNEARLPFEYTVKAEIGHIRVSGRASLPNGVILIGTLDKVGSGQIDMKEALVMNHLFTLEFGPELYAQYFLQGLQDVLQAGLFRLTVEFDPARQSPFAQESLSRSSLVKASQTPEGDVREADAATMRISQTFTIGTTAAQEEAQVRERQYQGAIRQHLRDTLSGLINFWERLHTHYQDERSKGNFSQSDSRAGDWQTWSSQWLNEIKDFADQTQLDETVSPASPYYPVWEALGTLRKQLTTLASLYFDVLTNDRPLTDRELQRIQRLTRYALGDAIAQLGQPDNVPLSAAVASVKPTVVVLSPLVHIRSGPGIHYASIKQVKKDGVLDWVGEQGEWLQVQLDGGRMGWVHRSVASKRPQSDSTIGDVRRAEGLPYNLEQGVYPQLEPISPSSTPVEFIPHPTSDEVKIYGEMEQELRSLQVVKSEERRTAEESIIQRLSEKHGISPEQVWNTYLKVQGWQIRP